MKHWRFYLVALVLVFEGVAWGAEGLVAVGVARVDVTPGYAVRLSGYGVRRAVSSGVAQRIYAKALVIGSDAEGPAVLLTVDNCGVPAWLRAEVVQRLAARAGIKEERVAICSSHTHSAPMVVGVLPNLFSMDIPAEQWAVVERYSRELVDRLEEVAVAALGARVPSRLAWGVGKVAFAVNRRGQVVRPVDHDLPVLRVTDAAGRVRGVLASYACHCTTVGFNEVHGDWAGCAQEFLEKEFPGAVALVAIGCGADQNPSPRGTFALARAHGDAVGAEAGRLVRGELQGLSGRLECRTRGIALPFAALPSREEWVGRAEGKSVPEAYHARRNLARLERGEKLPTELPYLVQVWNFGEELAMVFLPGEVVVDYGLRLKRELDGSRLWVNGYANDVPCYIPSKRVLTEGGYEGAGAMVYYDRPARFATNVEELIIGTVRELVPAGFVASRKQVSMPPARTALESLGMLRLRPGMVAELVASEPLVESPVAIDFGADGRLWVVELRDYPQGMDGKWQAGGRVKVLRSSRGDGRFDRAEIFLEGLPFPTGVMGWGKGALICAAPDILYAEDTDGDGRADVVRKVFTGFATNNFQARVNGLTLGLDGWVHGANGLLGGMIEAVGAAGVGVVGGKGSRGAVDIRGYDFRMRPDAGVIETVSGLTQQGRVRDDWGNWFGCHNSQALMHYPLPAAALRRNPHAGLPVPRVNLPGGAEGNVVFPVSAPLERFNSPQSFGRITSGCGLGIYRDEVLGAGFYGDAFVCEPVHNLVTRLKLTASGLTFSAKRAAEEKGSQFLASADNWFRPVQAVTGPDGALWVVDMYRFVVEHPRWIAAERLAELDVRAGAERGRIYRIFPVGAKLRPVWDLAGLGTRELLGALDTANGTRRDLVQRELMGRDCGEGAEVLKEIFAASTNAAVRVQALAVLEGLGLMQRELLVRGLADGHAGVRRHAVRLSEKFLAGDAAVAEAVLARENDGDAGVRGELALVLGAGEDARGTAVLGRLASRGAGDAWMRAAVVSSAVGRAGELVAAVGVLPEGAAGRGELLGALAATVAATAGDGELARVLGVIAPAGGGAVAGWQFVAVGALEEALRARGKGVLALEKSVDARVREVAGRVRSLHSDARRIAVDRQAEEGVRVAAVKLLGRGFNDPVKDGPVLTTLLSPAVPNAVQLAALEQLQRLPGVPVAELLLRRWTVLPVALRGAVIETLLSREEWTLRVLDAVEKGALAISELPGSARLRLQLHGSEAVKLRLARVVPPVRADRAAVLALYRGVEVLRGDLGRGEEVYRKNCAACHALHGVGFALGPDLEAFRGRPVADFLGAILDPNAAIEPRFVAFNVEVIDGRSLTGVIAAETGLTVTLALAGGASEVLPRTSIRSLKASAVSLMPEGFETTMPPQAMADLLAWINQ